MTGGKLGALERQLPPRPLEKRVTQAPVEFRLGGEPVTLRVLTIAEARPWKAYVTAKLGELAATQATGEALVELLMRLLRDSTAELLDVVLRYDVDGIIPARTIDDSDGLYRSSWVDEHATELEVEDAFLSVVTVGLPFGRRIRSLVEGQDWPTLLRSLRELQLPSTPKTPRPPTSTS